MKIQKNSRKRNVLRIQYESHTDQYYLGNITDVVVLLSSLKEYLNASGWNTKNTYEEKKLSTYWKRTRAANY